MKETIKNIGYLMVGFSIVTIFAIGLVYVPFAILNMISLISSKVK